MASRLLVIDDEPAVHMAMRAVAAETGYELHSAMDGRRGYELAQSGDFDFAIVDLGLPEMGGIELCRKLRVVQPFIPIVILTSRTDELSAVLGLELGADDYVTKPFSVAELAARIRGIGRRIERYKAPSVRKGKLQVGDLVIDLAERTVTIEGRAIDLARLEFDILAYLADRLGQSISRSELLANVWGYETSSYDHTITTHLSRLRRKIEGHSKRSRYLQTVRSFGYRLVDPTNAESMEEDAGGEE